MSPNPGFLLIRSVRLLLLSSNLYVGPVLFPHPLYPHPLCYSYNSVRCACVCVCVCGPSGRLASSLPPPTHTSDRSLCLGLDCCLSADMSLRSSEDQSVGALPWLQMSDSSCEPLSVCDDDDDDASSIAVSVKHVGGA